VVHENPGITPEVIRFSRFVIEAGFTVYMPSLFGTVGRGYDIPNLARQMVLSCIRKEFAALAQRRSSPVTEFLRGLCHHAHAECGGIGVGAIGMCLTGNFALSMMLDPAVMAPVLSQPSLPGGLTKAARSDLHVSDAELAMIKHRVISENLKVLGLRFSHDTLCPKARFDRLRSELGENFEGIEIDSSLGNPYGNPIHAHSVLTLHLVDTEGHPTRQALDRTLAFFRERLLD
jgi:dienelactone hydrolase